MRKAGDEMADQHSLLETLHDATHRVPGVPEHADRPAGHQGVTHHGRPTHIVAAALRSPGGARNHSAARPPRVLAAWQRRIAALFGQEI